MNDAHDEKLRRFNVLGLRTLQTCVFDGYTDNRGRNFVYTDEGEKRISYVDLGVSVRGVSAAYVFRHQLDEDPGLYKFVESVRQPQRV